MKGRLITALSSYFWLLADQGVFAFSNFAVNVQFARWLSPRDYGLFTISFSGYLLLTVLHYGCLLEPLLVLSPQIDKACRRSYVGSLLALHAVTFAVIGVVCGCAYLACTSLGSPDAGLAIVGAGLGGSCLLMLLTARRLCLVFLDASVSAIIGAVYFVGVIATAYLYRTWWTIAWFDTWKIVGMWSLICSLIIFAILYLRLSGNEPYSLKNIFSFQRGYAPLALVASVSLWLGSEALYLILARTVGLEAAAQTRALSLLINPLAQLTVAMNASWLIGFAARSRQEHNLLLNALPFLGIFVFAAIVFHFCGYWLVGILYHGRYVDAAWQLPLFCMSTCMTGLSVMISGSFKTRGNLWIGTVPQVVIGVSGLVLGAEFVFCFGQPGVAFGFFSSNVLALAMAILLVHSRRSVSAIP